MPGQPKEARTITLNLTAEDCISISEKAAAAGLTVSELLESFIGDLINGSATNGSDERELANQWFNRCFFLHEPTFLAALANYETSYTLEDAITAQEAIEAQEDAAKWESILDDAYNEYTETQSGRQESKSEALSGLTSYRQQLKALLGQKGAN